MANGISGGSTLPRVDYTAIERRIRTEKVDSFAARKPQLEAAIANAQATYEPLRARYDKELHHAENINTLKNVGSFIGLSASLGGILGAMGGAVSNLGHTRLSSIGVGAALGAVLVPTGLGLVGAITGGFRTGALFTDVPPVPDEVTAAYQPLADATNALVDAEHDARSFASIKPGEPWMRTPTAADAGAPTVQSYVEQVFAAHDHDHDGQLNIEHPSALTPANEYLRNRQGGPVASDRDAEANLSYPYELPIGRLERYDTDHSRTVSRDELATGMVTDSGRGSGRLYWNAD